MATTGVFYYYFFGGVILRFQSCVCLCVCEAGWYLLHSAAAFQAILLFKTYSWSHMTSRLPSGFVLCLMS